MAVLIGLCIRMGVDAHKLLKKDFSSYCDVISRSQRGPSGVTVMSPKSHCRVMVMSEGHHEATSTDHCSSDFRIENLDF